MSKLIPLTTQEQFAIVDDEDFEWLNQWKWRAWWSEDTKGFYAVRSHKRDTISMAREILGLKKGDKNQPDHINHKTLDNRKLNLRICTNRQNHYNLLPRSNGTSKYKGISWSKSAKKWVAYIRMGSRNKNLGCFDNEIEAAKTYDTKAKELFGEFARTNF